MFETLPRLNGSATVEFLIDGNRIVIELDGDNAPITAGNFVDLVQRGVYDGAAFHRVIDGFVAQGGDPQSLDPNFPVANLGTGGFIDPDTNERRNIPLEIKLEGDNEPTYNTELGRLGGITPPPDVVLEHEFGAIAMARATAPDTASSQFYFALDELDFLDGDYAVFGNVTEGLELIDDIEIGDRIEDAEVIAGLENFSPDGVADPTINPIELFRFRNTGFDSGTYLFVGSEERDSIVDNPALSRSFDLEGDGNSAFTASTTESEGLVPFYRLRSTETEGTYLFVGTEEYNAIFAEGSDQRDKWVGEGLDAQGEDVAEFYLYGVGAGEGEAFNRFQNNNNGTYLFAGPEETRAINNDPNLSAIFTDQGVAFESLG